MSLDFDVDKIANYLEEYKNKLPLLYQWSCNIKKLIELDLISKNQQIDFFNLDNNFEKGIYLKKHLGDKLKLTNKSNKELFDEICLWIIKDWGGITSVDDNSTLRLISDFLNKKKSNYNRIASSSKIGSFMFPEENIIYDSRVAYSLNWIILSQNAGNMFFPIPEGRNSKMMAFDLKVLIRLNYLSNYHPSNIEDLNNRFYIKNVDKNFFIDKENAYSELNSLVKSINNKLWKGEKEKENNLYLTEMLLFSIADKEIFMDITKNYKEKINKIRS